MLDDTSNFIEESGTFAHRQSRTICQKSVKQMLLEIPECAISFTKDCDIRYKDVSSWQN